MATTVLLSLTLQKSELELTARLMQYATLSTNKSAYRSCRHTNQSKLHGAAVHTDSHGTAGRDVKVQVRWPKGTALPQAARCYNAANAGAAHLGCGNRRSAGTWDTA